MERKFINSGFSILDLKTIDELNSLAQYYLIAIEKVGEYFVCEYCKEEDICELIPTSSLVSGKQPQKKAESEADKIAEYRAVELHKDPFGKYSGKTLGEIIDANDESWYTKVVSSMKNDYIRTRLEFLHDHKHVEDDGLPF